MDASTPLCTSICIDSRKATPGALFFALQGEHADGHTYVAKALEAGAVGVVVSHPIENVSGTQLVVPDTLRALGDLAMHYRRQFTLPVIGITGSVGKTSTKEMIAAVLRTKYNVLTSEKNYNNEIGVPLTIFQLTREHTAAVIEMGMRALGEIDRLAEIAQPNIGIITNIGHAHLEFLGSQENIARAKAELFARLPADGIAIIPVHTFGAAIILKKIPKHCRRITYEGGKYTEVDRLTPYFADSERLFPDRATVRGTYYGTVVNPEGKVTFRVRVGNMVHSLPVSLQVVGSHHIPNAMAALAVGHALDIPTPQAISALEGWQGAEGRMTVRHTADGLTILDDCYNAGPESMREAITTLNNMVEGEEGRTGVAILGDMRELGDIAEREHISLGWFVRNIGVRLLITVGPLAKHIGDLRKYEWPYSTKRPPPIREIVHFPDTESAVIGVRELVKPGDTILVKGSRALEMEKIVAALTGEESAGGHG
ncbi:MAG TPA: UDP-N-acetylmuramoyl-tripeptide--D-alanyl-D-alanine ligase [Chthonomonadaceae bacterium]|nr:UDP-N-acetylmuramoyl-tripeptide--D-alanyl-D-alanine ligase [Chthonomonadaceae bacterium]